VVNKIQKLFFVGGYNFASALLTTYCLDIYNGFASDVVKIPSTEGTLCG